MIIVNKQIFVQSKIYMFSNRNKRNFYMKTGCGQAICLEVKFLCDNHFKKGLLLEPTIYGIFSNKIIQKLSDP